ncbi:CLUMA_CG018627, isoform A [Clunio marinus]|uniref:CLUMA_CG018627, isoform A n=1 Tax=Clunio marinus TaxID=568069 RepID=A0A1J1IY60_9DIPT|nr:CLUMA_CG018627, isoform A [Clunio marinus]
MFPLSPNPTQVYELENTSFLLRLSLSYVKVKSREKRKESDGLTHKHEEKKVRHEKHLLKTPHNCHP